MALDALHFWQRIDSLNKETLKDLCEKSKVDYKRVMHNRTDCRIPKAEDLLYLAKSLGSSVEYLLTGENSNTFSPEAQFVETNETMRTLVRYCMNDTRLLPALELVIEQTRSDKGVDNKGLA